MSEQAKLETVIICKIIFPGNPESPEESLKRDLVNAECQKIADSIIHQVNETIISALYAKK